jgi:hypothetical protein
VVLHSRLSCKRVCILGCCCAGEKSILVMLHYPVL